MKRKIAVILASDVAGYSRLIAEDEEEAIHRLASYRSVFTEFIQRFHGRIFNTAGDAILAEFPSAVDAVRCAVDIQETLRARNLAYPASRQMHFRIGINIGDVVESDADLLGDGVNIAARLESVAAPGGICISRSVHESVANKLSIRFFDQGKQQLKNMPERVHAYTVALDENSPKVSPAGEYVRRATGSWRGIAAISLAAIALGSLGAYVALDRRTANDNASSEEQQRSNAQGAGLSVPQSPAPSSGDSAKTDESELQYSTAELTALGKASPSTAEPEATQQEEKASQAEPVAHESPKPVPNEVEKVARAEPEADRPAAAVPPPSNADPLTAKFVLQRNLTDCLEGPLEVALTACQPIVEGKLVGGTELASFQVRYGKALREKQQVDKAIKVYSDAIRLAPNADAFHSRAVAYYDKGDWERAVADFSESIRLDGYNGQAYNDRAWTLFQAGNPRMALRDADSAVRILPNAANVWDTRGHIHEALGNREDAIRDFRKALALDSSNAASRDALKRLGASP